VVGTGRSYGKRLTVRSISCTFVPHGQHGREGQAQLIRTVVVQGGAQRCSADRSTQGPTAHAGTERSAGRRQPHTAEHHVARAHARHHRACHAVAQVRRRPTTRPPHGIFQGTRKQRAELSVCGAAGGGSGSGGRIPPLRAQEADSQSTGPLLTVDMLSSAFQVPPATPGTRALPWNAFL